MGEAAGGEVEVFWGSLYPCEMSRSSTLYMVAFVLLVLFLKEGRVGGGGGRGWRHSDLVARRSERSPSTAAQLTGHHWENRRERDRERARGGAVKTIIPLSPYHSL